MKKRLAGKEDWIFYGAIAVLLLHLGKLALLHSVRVYEDSTPESEFGKAVEIAGSIYPLARLEGKPVLDFLLESFDNTVFADRRAEALKNMRKAEMDQEKATNGGAGREGDAQAPQGQMVRARWEGMDAFFENNIFRTVPEEEASEEEGAEEAPIDVEESGDPSSPPENAVVADSETSAFKWKLTGATLAGKKRLAALKDPESGKQKLFQPGENIQEGYQVAAVERNFIIVRSPASIFRMDRSTAAEDGKITVLKRFHNVFEVGSEPFDPIAPDAALLPPPPDMSDAPRERTQRPFSPPEDEPAQPAPSTGAERAATDAGGKQQSGDKKSDKDKKKEKREEPAAPKPICSIPQGAVLASVPRKTGKGDELKVTGVQPGSFAETVGLKKDDVIRVINNVSVDTIASYAFAIKNCPEAGKTVITLERNGMPLTKTFTAKR